MASTVNRSRPSRLSHRATGHAYHVLPSRYRQEHFDAPRSAAIEVTPAQQIRQLEVATPEEVYRRGGGFNTDARLATMQETLKTSAKLGFPVTRLIAHPEAVLQDGPTTKEWVKRETRLNNVLLRYHDPVICTYDANLLNRTIAVDNLGTRLVAVNRRPARLEQIIQPGRPSSFFPGHPQVAAAPARSRLPS
jgi:hypothetical protein